MRAGPGDVPTPLNAEYECSEVRRGLPGQRLSPAANRLRNREKPLERTDYDDDCS